MKSKTELASELLRVIQSLGLSPQEVKHLTFQWVKSYPYLLEDFGWNIQIHTRVKNIMAEIEKLQALLHQAELAEDLFRAEAENKAPTALKDNLTPAPTLPLVAPPTSSSEEAPAAEPPALNAEAPSVTEASPVVKAPPLEPKSAPPKGYSKNGKRLGRPPKPQTETAASPKPNTAPKDQPQKKSKAKTATPDDAPPKTEPEQPPESVSPALMPSPPPNEKELLEQLKYGKQYAYDLLYLVNSVYVRSPFKLRDEAGVRPIGVVIPYTHQNEAYEIVVYYTDETASIPLNIAKKYAKNKLLPYKDVPWRVKMTTDDAHIRPALAEINEIFKKMGGQPLKGNYLDARGNYYAKADFQHKIRYVCDIPLSQEKQST